MNKQSVPDSYDVLHDSDQDRIIEAYSGEKSQPTINGLLISTFFFVVSTWAIIFVGYDHIFEKVDGAIQLRYLPYYFGLLGGWIFYTVNYSYFFLKKAQPFISGKVSSVGAALIIQSFVYGVMGFAIALKHFRSSDEATLSSLLSLRIPLIDNPLNMLAVVIFLFALGVLILFLSMGAKTNLGKEKTDRFMFVVAMVSIYAFTLFYNVATQGWVAEFMLTSAMFTSIVMIGVVPYVYASGIFNGAKASVILTKLFYSSLFGGIYIVLLLTSYRLSKELFIVMHSHDSIDFFNPSLIFVAAILVTAFTRVLMYPKLIDEYNTDVLQTRRINESNKGIMADDDYLPGDDFEDGIEDEDLFGDKQPKKSKSTTPKKTTNYDDDDGFALSIDDDMDGIMED